MDSEFHSRELFKRIVKSYKAGSHYKCVRNHDLKFRLELNKRGGLVLAKLVGEEIIPLGQLKIAGSQVQGFQDFAYNLLSIILMHEEEESERHRLQYFISDISLVEPQLANIYENTASSKITRLQKREKIIRNKVGVEDLILEDISNLNLSQIKELASKIMYGFEQGQTVKIGGLSLLEAFYTKNNNPKISLMPFYCTHHPEGQRFKTELVEIRGYDGSIFMIDLFP